MDASSIVNVILAALIAYLIWNIQRLTVLISAVQKEFNDFKVKDAGSDEKCRGLHLRIDERFENHEDRILKLEDPEKKSRKHH